MPNSWAASDVRLTVLEVDPSSTIVMVLGAATTAAATGTEAEESAESAAYRARPAAGIDSTDNA